MVDFLGEHNVAEGSFKLNLISRQDIKVTNMDLTDSTDYIDRYHPYKYGVIFRERLFVSNPEVFGTFRLNMFKIEGDKGGAEDSKGGAPVNPKDKKAPAGKGTAAATTALHPPAVDYEHSKELDTPRMIYLELFEEGELKQTVSGLNETTLSTSILSGDKQGGKNYYLQARFELRDFPEAALSNRHTQGLFWCLSVSGTDTIVVAKDTQREEKEKSLIESWEAHEHGRKDKAKNNRLLFQARKKKADGQDLTEEEAKLLHDSKADKYAQEDAGKKGAAGAKGVAGAKQPAITAKKGAQVAAKKDVKDQQKAEEQQKELIIPKSNDHNMSEVKGFLRHMEEPRMKVEQIKGGLAPRVRTDAEFSEIYETCLMTKEDSLSQLERLAKRREDLKKQRDDVYDQKMKGYNKYVEEMKKQYESLKDEFGKINNEATKRKEDETALVGNLESEAIQESALKDAINKAKQNNVDGRLIYAAEKYLKNLVIRNACTTLKEKLDTFDEAGVKAQKQFIEQHYIELDEDLQLQIEDFFINIETNPNYIQEKLAEMKKQPKAKGGRK